MIWHIIFSGAFVIQKDSPFLMRWMFEIDVMKHATDGMITAIFGWNREKLPCNDIYCHFQRPGDLLKHIGLDENVINNFLMVGAICIVFHTLTYFNMRKWLKK